MNVARASTDVDLTGSVYGAKFKEIEIVSGISASGEVLPSESKDRLNTLQYFSVPSPSSNSDYVMIAKSGDGTLNYWMGDANFMATASYTYGINTTKPYVSGQQALVDIASAPNLENVNVAILRGGKPLPSLTYPTSEGDKILYYFNADITSCYPESGSTIFNGSPSSSVRGSGSIVNADWEYNSGDSYFNLDGTDDYIRVEEDDPLAESYTLGARVYFPAVSEGVKIASNWGDDAGPDGLRFLLMTNSIGRLRVRTSSDGTSKTAYLGNASNLLATGSWYNVAFSYNQSEAELKMYAENVTSSTFTSTDHSSVTISTVNDGTGIISMIGADGNPGNGSVNSSKIQVKSFFIANSVLTGDEILAMLSTGSV